MTPGAAPPPVIVAVTPSTVMVLVAIAAPTFSAARAAARTTVCGSNLRQLTLANLEYALENRDHYVLAAEDIWQPIERGWGGRRRWHGVRDHAGEPFDPARGPLAGYLGADGRVRACPSFRAYVDNAFEAGNGGYGYNGTYIGGRADLYGTPNPRNPRAAQTSARTHEVREPAATVVFTDAALAQPSAGGAYLIEYSFCHAPYPQLTAGAPSRSRGTPSIHFRHPVGANVAWADGHVAPQRLRFSGASVGYGLSEAQERSAQIGWFGPDSNRLFDLK